MKVKSTLILKLLDEFKREALLDWCLNSQKWAAPL
jgi:hypothetical protein